MNNDYEWLKPIDVECKKKCLGNFIRQMSMNFLTESTCGICNVRWYKRNMHYVPLNKIPSIELLRVHNELKHVISVLQETRSLYLNDKFSWNEAVSLALTQSQNETG